MGRSGCTAVVALLAHDGKIYVVHIISPVYPISHPIYLRKANAGDSRSVLCTKGEVVALSTDHKPQNACEILAPCRIRIHTSKSIDDLTR